MQRHGAPRRRSLATALVLFLALGSAGCLPGAVWLPDSSGIVYTGGKDFTKVIHYDLGKRAQRVLVADTGAPTFWPAVSPDGKRIAVARIDVKEKKGPATMQVIVYSRDGKEMQRSKAFPWTDKSEFRGEKGRHPMPQLFWAPRNQGILVNDAENGNVGIYDPKADRLLNLKEGWLLNFAGGPVRPDGAGFLVMRNSKGFLSAGNKKGAAPARFDLVAWDGMTKAIKPPPLLLDQEALRKERDFNKLTALLSPLLYQSGWDNDVARVSWNVDRLRYFTNKGEAVLDTVKPLLADDGRIVQMRHKFPGGQAEVRVVSTATPEKLEGGQEGGRIEIVKAGQQKVEVVQADAKICVPTVSPNGRMLALWCVSGPAKMNQERIEILIIDDRGAVTARLHVPR